MKIGNIVFLQGAQCFCHLLVFIMFTVYTIKTVKHEKGISGQLNIICVKKKKKDKMLLIKFLVVLFNR